ncbi:hypothetical protein T02_7916 [Trichinella nativa]|uniref:Uncharacterized protein n=1 Tax=Trichinella nativa TaxID=6335 RepID=A0A0V1KQ92_9BILA|nr:hypothetical protein T02_7916 [Trichinella nativa]
MKNGISFMDPLEKMLQTHKYHINTAITGTCIKQSFTISYMHKFICMLKAKGVRNAYIELIFGLYFETLCNSHLCEKPFSLTAKVTVAKYLRSMTTQDRDVVETKQSRIHFPRKMDWLLTTLWSNSSAAMNALSIIQLVEDAKKLAKSYCLILTITKGRFVFIVVLQKIYCALNFHREADCRRTKNTATLTRFVKRDGTLLITEWNDSSAASKAEQLRDAFFDKLLPHCSNAMPLSALICRFRSVRFKPIRKFDGHLVKIYRRPKRATQV